MSADDALISVIVPSFRSRRTLPRCLEALQGQEDPGPYEILVADSSDDGSAELVAERFPGVKLLRSAERLAPGAARNLAIAASAGEILAFTDADCIPSPQWIVGIRRAHAGGAPAVGGAIANGNPDSYLGWAYYFCKLSGWMPGTPDAAMEDVPTGCLSVKRWAMETFGPFRERGYSSDTDFSWKLVSAGHRTAFVPSIQVAHVNIDRPGELVSKLYEHGRAFARLRVRREEFSRSKRSVYALCAPALAFVMFARVRKRVVRSGVYLREFRRAAPLVFLGYAVWSAGELRGYLDSTI